jgi:hypothetical protein
MIFSLNYSNIDSNPKNNILISNDLNIKEN